MDFTRVSWICSFKDGPNNQGIFARLRQEELLFLTHHEDFVNAAPDCKASIIWSRVSQSMAIEKRVGMWLNAIQQFFSKTWKEEFFELYDDGTLYPVEVIKT
ncbi:MAG: hypothetical protein ACREQV_07920 [Candidatus Binatia bacterium]